MKITAQEIEAKRTKNGGFTKAQLAEWGVDWPARKGWKKRLISGDPPNVDTLGEPESTDPQFTGSGNLRKNFETE